MRTFLLATRTKTAKRGILGTILVERVLDAIVLGIMLLVLAYGLLRRVELPSATTIAIVAGASALILLAALLASSERSPSFYAHSRNHSVCSQVPRAHGCSH